MRLILIEGGRKDEGTDCLVGSLPFGQPKLAFQAPSPDALPNALRDYFVYLMRMLEPDILALETNAWRIKVGRSVNPKERRRKLQTGNPYELILDFTVRVIGRSCNSALNVGRAIERMAQRILSKSRLRKEWFFVTQDVAREALKEATTGARQQQIFEYEFSPEPWQERFGLQAA